MQAADIEDFSAIVTVSAPARSSQPAKYVPVVPASGVITDEPAGALCLPGPKAGVITFSEAGAERLAEPTFAPLSGVITERVGVFAAEPMDQKQREKGALEGSLIGTNRTDEAIEADSWLPSRECAALAERAEKLLQKDALMPDDIDDINSSIPDRHKKLFWDRLSIYFET